MSSVAYSLPTEVPALPALEEIQSAVTAPVLVQVGRETTTKRRNVARRVPRSVARLYGPLLLLALWEAASLVGILSPDALPAPTSVIGAAEHLIAVGTLQVDLWASLQRVLKGLVLGVSGGTALAIAAGLTRWGENFLDSTMQVLKAIPHFALIGLFIIWLGIGEMPKITLIALATAMPIYVNVYGAIRNVDQRIVEVATTLGLGRPALIRHVILPGIAPGFFTGLRIAFTSAWLALIFAESVNAPTGLGQLMQNAENFYQLNVVVLVIMLYAVLGLLSYSLVRALERRFLSWRVGFQIH